MHLQGLWVKMWTSLGDQYPPVTGRLPVSLLLLAVCSWSPRPGAEGHRLQWGPPGALHNLQPETWSTDSTWCHVLPLPGHLTVGGRHSVCQRGLLQALPCGKRGTELLAPWKVIPETAGPGSRPSGTCELRVGEIVSLVFKTILEKAPGSKGPRNLDW